MECCEVNIKQKVRGNYAARKYSELDKGDIYNTRMSQSRADWATVLLLKNGYVVMDGYSINEVWKLIRTLRELNREFTMKTIEKAGSPEKYGMYYEFTTVYFEDDRTNK